MDFLPEKIKFSSLPRVLLLQILFQEDNKAYNELKSQLRKIKEQKKDSKTDDYQIIIPSELKKELEKMEDLKVI